MAVMCRNHRGFVEATAAISKLGADALYLNTAFAAPQLTEVVGREKPKAIVYDEEFGELLSDAAKRRKRFVAWHDSESCDDPTIDELIAAGDPSDVVPPDARGPRHDPDERDDRLAQGRLARQPAVARPGGVAAVEDPAEVAPGDPHRRAAVPLLGLRPLLARADPRLDLRAAAQVRPGGLPGRGGAPPLRLARRRAGDDAAHPRAAGGDALEVRPLLAEGGGGQRLGAARRPRDRVDGRLRRQPLQPVRLDRGGVGVDRHAGRHARRPGHRGQAAARHRREALRRGAARGAAGRDGPHLRRQRDAVRGLHRRRLEGRDREPDGHRRRRPLRRGRAPVRRGPRRRDDRVGRRERVPEGGRGPALTPRGGGRGGRAGRGGQGLRPAPARLRRARGGQGGERGRPQGLRQEEPRRLQGAARDRLHGRAAPQRHREGAQARAGGARRRDREGRSGSK